MKQRKISKELVQETVDALNEVEDAVLDVKTGVKAGRSSNGEAGSPVALDYGCPSPCTSPD